MYVTITHFKGGVGKTTTAVHLATFLYDYGPTVLIDGDPNRSATIWKSKGNVRESVLGGKNLPFAVVDREEAPYQARNYTHVVTDTEARPGFADFEKLARGCDLLIIPSDPYDMESEALKNTIAALHDARVPAERYRVLLTKVPPAPEDEAGELRKLLTAAGIPLFKAEIPYLKCFKKAFTQGVIVRDVPDLRAARAWRAYQLIGKEIIQK